MDTIHERARDIPVAAEADLCVVGGSCTGVFAAAAAARLGARVALVESNGFFGGVATGGLVCVWHSLLDTQFEQQVIGGLTAEVLGRLERRDAAYRTRPSPQMNYVFNPAELKIELDELVRESRVRPFLHARFVAAAAEGDRLAAVIVEDKTGRRAIRAGCFIDTTGDGDVVARLGLPFRSCPGKELQPPTACAVIRGLAELARQNPGFSLEKCVFDPRYPQALKKGFLWHVKSAGAADETMVAGTRISGANCADADELTGAEMEGRRQIRQMVDLLRANFKGGKGVSLAETPACIGIRETRHAECLHTLTEAEVLAGTRFPDAIANGTYRVDVHHSDREGLTFRYLNGREVYVAADSTSQSGRWRPETASDPTFYQIPYRSLVSRGAQNLLVAGRLIDADRGAFGAIRVMVNCNQTGQAAGVAAHLALDAGKPLADVPTDRLRRTLKDQGAVIL